MKLKIKFADITPSFTYGVEYGRLLERMERGEYLVTNNGFPVRLENKEVLNATCKEYGYLPIWGRSYYGEMIEFCATKGNFN